MFCYRLGLVNARTIGKYFLIIISTFIIFTVLSLNPFIFCQTNNDRLSLSTPIQLSSDTIPLISAHVVASGDTIHAIWFGIDIYQTTSSDGIQYCHSFDGGKSFSLKTTIVSADTAFGPGLIASSNQFVYIAYSGFINEQFGTVLLRSHDAGMTWENSILILPNTLPLLVCANGSTVFIHYQNQRGGKCGLMRSDDYGETWNNVSTNMFLLNDLKISNDILYAVGSLTISRAEVGLYYSYDLGSRWIGPEIISREDRTPSVNPKLTLSSTGNIFVVWNDTGNVILRRTDGYDQNENLIWLPQTIISSDQHAVFIDISVMEKFVIIVWDNQSNISKVIQRSYSIDEGKAFGPIDTLTGNNNAGEPVMTISNKKIHFVWSEEFNATNNIIYRRGYMKEPVRPTVFVLRQNYPNPVNGVCHIEYDLTASEHVKLILYNLLGQKVATFLDEYQEQNFYKISIDANSYPSGVYFYRLITGCYSQTKKMVILK